MSLNNCETCGRKPKIGHTKITGFNAWCSCGKTVFSDFGIWPSEEVAADMWNRANQQDEALRKEYINQLAWELANYSLRAIVTDNGLTIKQTIDTDEETARNIRALFKECEYHKQELTEFYKKRLEPGAIA